ncbi:hypothetical protein M885DRAFT_537529 [Pelagophyceae sp. CCMP2097]|nr:hypothetical protein M885DRAFT_537529 [Pelagophyceae sp. CCMP2097]
MPSRAPRSPGPWRPRRVRCTPFYASPCAASGSRRSAGRKSGGPKRTRVDLRGRRSAFCVARPPAAARKSRRLRVAAERICAESAPEKAVDGASSSDDVVVSCASAPHASDSDSDNGAALSSRRRCVKAAAPHSLPPRCAPVRSASRSPPGRANESRSLRSRRFLPRATFVARQARRATTCAWRSKS